MSDFSITCHTAREKGPGAFWYQAMPYTEPFGVPYRSCSYCGCIHPEDFLNLLEAGQVTVSEIKDDKSWPYKFAVHGVRNVHAGQQVLVRTRTDYDDDGNPDRSYFLGDAPEFVPVTWVSTHLLDLAQQDEDMFEAIALHMQRLTDILFFVSPEGVTNWRYEPYQGNPHE